MPPVLARCSHRRGTVSPPAPPPPPPPSSPPPSTHPRTIRTSDDDNYFVQADQRHPLSQLPPFRKRSPSIGTESLAPSRYLKLMAPIIAANTYITLRRSPPPQPSLPQPSTPPYNKMSDDNCLSDPDGLCFNLITRGIHRSEGR